MYKFTDSNTVSNATNILVANIMLTGDDEDYQFKQVVFPNAHITNRTLAWRLIHVGEVMK